MTNYVFDISRCVESISKDLQRLPLESARVFTGGIKQPTNIAKGLRKRIGWERAKAFYTREGIFDNRTFESINCEALQVPLVQATNVQYLVQEVVHRGYCGTSKWLKRWSRGKEDPCCPNCTSIQEEDTAHLMVCRSAERTTLFRKSVDNIHDWTKAHHTESEHQKPIKIYLLNRETRKFWAIWGLSNRMQSPTTTLHREKSHQRNKGAPKAPPGDKTNTADSKLVDEGLCCKTVGDDRLLSKYSVASQNITEQRAQNC